MQKIITVIFIISFVLIVSCSRVREKGVIAAYKIKQICLAQKKFFEQKERYGELQELAKEGLLRGDRLNLDSISDGQYNGYIYKISVTPKGYTALANPVGYGTGNAQGYVALYVDEKSKIKARFKGDGIDAGPNDEDYFEDGKEVLVCEE